MDPENNLLRMTENYAIFLHNTQFVALYRSEELLVLSDCVAKNRGADLVKHRG